MVMMYWLFLNDKPRVIRERERDFGFLVSLDTSSGDLLLVGSRHLRIRRILFTGCPAPARQSRPSNVLLAKQCSPGRTSAATTSTPRMPSRLRGTRALQRDGRSVMDAGSFSGPLAIIAIGAHAKLCPPRSHAAPSLRRKLLSLWQVTA
jgi:hypothetical protein